MEGEQDMTEAAIPFPEPAPQAAVPQPPTVDEVMKNLYAVSAKLTQEVAFRERMCAEAVAGVLEKYSCVVTIRDGSVQIVSRK